MSHIKEEHYTCDLCGQKIPYTVRDVVMMYKGSQDDIRRSYMFYDLCDNCAAKIKKAVIDIKVENNPHKNETVRPAHAGFNSHDACSEWSCPVCGCGFDDYQVERIKENGSRCPKCGQLLDLENL